VIQVILTYGDVYDVTATGKRQAKLDWRFKPRTREKAPLGVENTFLGNTKKKK
jgi:hypothetical protein